MMAGIRFDPIRRALHRRALLLAGLLLSAGLLSGTPAGADAPAGAAAAVHRLMAAVRAKDPAAFLAALAPDYNYGGLRKADFDPFGAGSVLSDRLFYRVTQLSLVGRGTATAIVESTFRGRFNLLALGYGEPTVVGTSRAWVEVKQQPNGGWLVSGLRLVRTNFHHEGTAQTDVQQFTVNGLTSARVAPGAILQVAGQTFFGIGVALAIAGSSGNLPLDLAKSAQDYLPWAAELKAPMVPGRYYVDIVSIILAPRSGGDVYLSWSEVSVPVIVDAG